MRYAHPERQERSAARRAAVLACLLWASATAHAGDDGSAMTISEGSRFVEQDGEGLYRAVCQSCRMAEGQGATGAGRYPALANNPTLTAAKYLVYDILHGRKGMPAFGRMLSDGQVAELTNYVRTRLGNRYSDRVSADDVKALR